MKERPILFSAPMVRAILEGRKTQTRRLFNEDKAFRMSKPYVNARWEDRYDGTPEYYWACETPNGMHLTVAMGDPGIAQQYCQYGQPSDRLWVRETWSSDDGRTAHYRVDGETYNHGLPWKPSIHMPRWASRITLEITRVRVERLQDISEEDAIAEGCTANHNGYYWGGPHVTSGLKQMATACAAYRDLWEFINGPGSWDANPWVWVIEFVRIKQ